MEIKALTTFVTVAELLSFSAAARKLNTVQPAISRQIADLEDELGVSLFWRNTREVKITAAGQMLLGDAHDILNREKKAREQTRRAAQGKTGTIRIGYLAPACLSFIPMLIRKYSALYPEVQVSLHDMTVKEQLAAFAAGRIDVGFSRPLQEADKPTFDTLEIYTDTLTAVLPESHSLAGAKSIRLGQLSAEPFVLFRRDEAVGLFDRIIGECHGEDFSPGITSQPRAMQTVLTEVASGLGVSIVPGCTQRLYSEGCVFVPIQQQKPSIPLELHSLTHQPYPTVSAFIDVTKESGKDIHESVFRH